MALLSVRRAVLALAYQRHIGGFASGGAFSTSITRNLSASKASSEPANNGVEHVVLLKVKQGTSKKQIQKFKEGINSLSVIPGVVSVSVGETFVERWMADRRGGYTHALAVRLDSKEALKKYQDHELHTQVKEECIAPIAESAIAVDWESPLTFGSSK